MAAQRPCWVFGAPAPTGLDKSVIRSLATCQSVRAKQNVIVVGKTGVANTFIGASLAQAASHETRRFENRVHVLRAWASVERKQASSRSRRARTAPPARRGHGAAPPGERTRSQSWRDPASRDDSITELTQEAHRGACGWRSGLGMTREDSETAGVGATLSPMPVLESVVAQVVQETSEQMKDAQFAQVAVGHFVQTQPDLASYLSGRATRLGGPTGVVDQAGTLRGRAAPHSRASSSIALREVNGSSSTTAITAPCAPRSTAWT